MRDSCDSHLDGTNLVHLRSACTRFVSTDEHASAEEEECARGAERMPAQRAAGERRRDGVYRSLVTVSNAGSRSV